MAEHVVYEQSSWQSNGAVGLRVACRNCGVLWESGPDRPYDPSQFAVVAKAHREEVKEDSPELSSPEPVKLSSPEPVKPE